MLRIVIPIALVLAQSGDAPSFEVISVKPSAMKNGGYGIGFFTFPGGRVLGNIVTLDYLIQQAFDIQSFQISGGPRWMHEDKFDLEAKPPASSRSSKSTPNSPKLPPNPEQRQMLRALLADRFRLEFHRETKEGPVYLLVRGNKALNLQPTSDKDEYPWVGSVAGAAIAGDGLRGTNATMALLASRLSQHLGRPVIERTGLEGAFDFKYEYHADGSSVDQVSAILTSVQGLGLKLETAKGPIGILVIDRAEKPAGN